MRPLFTILIFSLITLIPFQAHALGYLASSKKSAYIQVGFGITQFEYTDKYLSDYKITPSPSVKLLFGGRIGRSHHTWFEFNYTYNGAYQTEDITTIKDKVTTYRSQSMAMGLRLTTAPHKKTSTYLRLGAGRLFLENRQEYFTSNTSNRISNDYQTQLTNFGYAGIGADISLGRNARIGIEAQQIQYKIEDNFLSDNTVMVTLTRYLK